MVPIFRVPRASRVTNSLTVLKTRTCPERYPIVAVHERSGPQGHQAFPFRFPRVTPAANISVFFFFFPVFFRELRPFWSVRKALNRHLNLHLVSASNPIISLQLTREVNRNNKQNKKTSVKMSNPRPPLWRRPRVPVRSGHLFSLLVSRRFFFFHRTCGETATE